MTKKIPQIPTRFQALLQKAPKDMNKAELAVMAPLSQYNHWLAEARANALEVKKYQNLLETANFMVNKNDLIRAIMNRKRAVLCFLAKAEAALKESYKVEEFQAKQEAERKAKAEAERKAFQEKQKTEAEKAAAPAFVEEKVDVEEEDSENPAA